MREPVLFVEHATRTSRRYRPGDPPVVVREHWRGGCLDTPDGPGATAHRFADGTDLVDHVRLPPRSRARAARVLHEPPAEPDAPDTELAAVAEAYDVELDWVTYRQDVVVGPPHRLRRDERCGCTVEVVVTSPEGIPCTDAVPWTGAGDTGRLHDVARGLREHVALPRAEYPAAGCSVALEPGRAGAFFHELVGHPLEGDIVLTSSSYLARRQGQRVAPEWLTVTDGCAESGKGVTASVDDEGNDVSTVDLLRAGRVAGALVDTATGELLHTARTGHGRRLDYRHPVIPRMRHTTAVVAGAAPAPVSRPVLRPRGLGLRWMNLLTGDFEFEIGGAVLDLGDDRPHRTGRATLAGNALTVLGALRPGAAETVAYFRASRGCGKLGQFPLPVSFANGGVVIPAEAVHVRADA